MAAHILKMNNTDTRKFLQLYKKAAVLWDVNHEHYRDREIRNAALKRIAEIMNIDGFTEIHVTMKFRNLRSSYSQELKKIAASKKSGNSPDNVYKPKVIWFSLMNSFLKPHVKTRKMVIDDLMINISDEDASRSSDENLMIVLNNKVKSELISLSNPTLPEPSNTLKKAFKRMIIPETVQVNVDNAGLDTGSKMRRLNTYDHEIDEAEASLTVKKAEQIYKRSGNGTDSREHSLDSFAQYIVSLLRNLPNQKSIALQSKIISLILTDSYLDSNSGNGNHISEVFIEDLNDAQSEDFEYKDSDII